MSLRTPFCLHCKVSFIPAPCNRKRQKFCNGTPECIKASHRKSQKKWLKRPENHDYFRNKENVERVREWRKLHPGYSRKRKPEAALQDDCIYIKPINQPVTAHLPIQQSSPSSFSTALQDFAIIQPAVLIGLIAQLTSSTLQEDLAQTLRRMQQLGSDILNQPQSKGGHYAQTSSLSRTATRGP